ncbi:hypothetical protein F4553_004124 [Allocatelliglobosispora scoriae]|uniref:Beta-lactamase class A catalytic domain-containing protein n=1 Tax=Allocatelliglobosispora scoriae TaxID=643052 RepID=A0A841BSR2_9ACTN|nr:serine hydrolase [Allocatelliglobosispora scoriae]MBB5870745.1 hypothetical protein [Allocatelliglobosispora scoriae]
MTYQNPGHRRGGTDETTEIAVFAEPTREIAMIPAGRTGGSRRADPPPPPPDNRGRTAIIVGTVLLLAALVGTVVYAASGPSGNHVPTDSASWGKPAAGASGTRSAAPSKPPASPSSSPAKPSGTEMANLLVGPHTVKINASGWWSWALMDLTTGEIYGSKNMHGTNKTASMIKAWIGADFLRREAEAGRTPSDARLQEVTIMIRDSDNTAASSLFSAVGKAASTKRMISICGMKDSTATDNWSNTLLSPYDTAKLGACIASGKAAGDKWTKWLISEMQKVRGQGNFGIRKAFEASVQSKIAIKNGWVDRQATQEYTVNCLAIGDGWAMGVETRYPIALGMSYGADICKQVAAQLKN